MLIVDGDIELVHMMERCFREQGYEVRSTTQGNLVVEMCLEFLPHVIVLADVLPDVNSEFVWYQLRTTVGTKHIPIVFAITREGSFTIPYWPDETVNGNGRGNVYIFWLILFVVIIVVIVLLLISFLM